MKGYKVFNPDWECRGFQFEVGKTYELSGEISLCNRGFHFCLRLNDCFNYYNFNSNNKVAEIEFNENNVIHGEDKSVTGKITIVKELSWFEVLQLVNTGKNNTGLNNSGYYNSGNCNLGNCNSGDGNSGDYNSGYYNSGNYNSGNRNSGNYNSGYGNSGDYNSGNYNLGFFNTDEQFLRMFNKETTLKRQDIDLSFLYDMKLTEWISKENMSEKEKQENPNYETIGGYLKTFTYKEMWFNWYVKQNKEKIDAKIKALPNFDSKIFEEITGLEIK